VTEFLSAEEFWGWFESFEDTAYRLELRDRYAVDEEREPMRRFLAGAPADDAWFMDFFEAVRGWRDAGKRVERVRVVSEPLGDYARFLLDLARLNTAAGEDVRYLARERAAGLRLPDHDYWLFDSARVAVLHFDEEDRLVGVEPVTAPEVVVEHCRARDAAWGQAIRWADYRTD
jgi:hypothetical protein